MSEALAEHPAPPPPRFVADLDTLIRARYPLIYLVSWEEQRLDGILQDLATQHGKVLFSWSVTRGLRRVGGARAVAQLDPQKSPVEMLGTLAKLGEPSLVVLKDFHPLLSDPQVVRALRELAQDLKSTYTTVILLSPVLQIPVELEKEISVLDVPLPGFRDLYQLLREIVLVVRQGNRATVNLSREQAEQLIKAAQGLTLSEAENAFAKAIATDGSLGGQDIRLVLDEKRQVIRKSGLLEFVAVEEDLGNVGGVDALKQWLGNRAVAFGEPARKFGLPAPKGLLLLGVQGCGKSLTAKAIANQFEALPPELLRKGRFDEIFFIDLPAGAERQEIWSIHLARRKRDPARYDLAELARISETYSGSEIEQAVISALHFAFAEGVELEQKHLVRAVQETIPLSTTMGEDIARQREWAKTRARPASGPVKPPKVA